MCTANKRHTITKGKNVTTTSLNYDRNKNNGKIHQNTNNAFFFFFLMMESPGGVFVFLFVLSFLCSLLLYNEGRTQARQPLEACLRWEVGNTGSNT